MNARPSDPGFFVGYFKKVPPAIRRFTLIAGALIVGGLGGVSLGLVLTQDDPGPGRYAEELGPQALTGRLEARPYPILRLPAAAGRPARAIMLAGEGKQGVEARTALLAGRPVDAGGVLLKRGDLDMLQIEGDDGLRLSQGDVAAASQPPAPPVQLGRWRLSGEICDGKCYAGAMRPGAGLAHKACANLCIIGGQPPVFVSTAPVEGRSFFLLADEAGGPIDPAALHLTAVMLQIDGEVERRDDLMIFRVALDTAKVF